MSVADASNDHRQVVEEEVVGSPQIETILDLEGQTSCDPSNCENLSMIVALVLYADSPSVRYVAVSRVADMMKNFQYFHEIP